MSQFKWILAFAILLITVVVWQFARHGLVHTNSAEKQLKAEKISANDKSLDSLFTCEIIPGINNTWGYDILVDGRMKIHQPSIPGQPGNEGFNTKEKAEKVARLVIKKMKDGEMLPTITAEELKKLKAI